MFKKVSMFLGLATLALVAIACTPQTIEVEVTQVVDVEVEVVEEVEVIEEIEVEVEVTKVVETEVEIVEEVVVEQEVVLGDRGTLRLSHGLAWGAEETLDPYTPVRFYDYIRVAYNRLIRKSSDGLPSPALATDWVSNDVGDEWVLTLREGVLFHDGSEMTADDVVYSLNRMIDPAIDSPLLATHGVMTSIEKTGDYEVTIGLDAPNVDFPLLLTDYRALIMRDGGGDTINEDGIGTGPYMLDNFDIEGVTTLTAFDDYWEGPPGAAAVELIAIPDNEARVQALLAGQIDILGGLTPEQIDLFEGTDFEIQSIPAGGWRAFVMRTDTPPYDDARVRKALRVVADRDELVAQALDGNGVVSCDHPVWTGDQYRADIDCSQDIELAKELLAEAGYADGIEVTISTSPLDAIWPAMLEVYQAQAAEAGITVNIEQKPADGFWSDTWLVDPYVTTLWGERPAGQILNEAWRSGASWNETYWNDSEFDALLDAASAETDFETRKEIYAQIQTQLFEEGGAFIPFHLNESRIVNSCVSNVQEIGEFFLNFAVVQKPADC